MLVRIVFFSLLLYVLSTLHFDNKANNSFWSVTCHHLLDRLIRNYNIIIIKALMIIMHAEAK